MSYPESFVKKVLDYLDAGHSAREANPALASTTRALRAGGADAMAISAATGPAQKNTVEYREDGLGLACGGHRFRLDEVAAMVDVSAPTISNWKKRYIEGDIMEIPGIDPGEIKSYMLENTVKILKAEGMGATELLKRPKQCRKSLGLAA